MFMLGSRVALGGMSGLQAAWGGLVVLAFLRLLQHIMMLPHLLAHVRLLSAPAPT